MDLTALREAHVTFGHLTCRAWEAKRASNAANRQKNQSGCKCYFSTAPKALQLVEVQSDREFSFVLNNIKEVQIHGASLELGTWNLKLPLPLLCPRLSTPNTHPSTLPALIDGWGEFHTIYQDYRRLLKIIE